MVLNHGGEMYSDGMITLAMRQFDAILVASKLQSQWSAQQMPCWPEQVHASDEPI